MSVPTSNPGPIADVYPGLRVVDSAGEDVGTVEDVRTGDAGLDDNGPEDRGGLDDLLGAVMDAVTTGEGIADTDRERLQRLGYVRIDGAGFLSGNRDAAAEDIAAVEDGVVRLSVPGSHLVG